MPGFYTPNLSEELEEEDKNMILSGYACQLLLNYSKFQHGTLVELFNKCISNLANNIDS